MCVAARPRPRIFCGAATGGSASAGGSHNKQALAARRAGPRERRCIARLPARRRPSHRTISEAGAGPWRKAYSTSRCGSRIGRSATGFRLPLFSNQGRISDRRSLTCRDHAGWATHMCLHCGLPQAPGLRLPMPHQASYHVRIRQAGPPGRPDRNRARRRGQNNKTTPAYAVSVRCLHQPDPTAL